MLEDKQLSSNMAAVETITKITVMEDIPLIMSGTQPMGNETEEERNEFVSMTFLVPWGVVCSLITVLVVAGNFLVIYCFTKHRHLRTRGNSIVISMAVVDFMTGCICIPLKIFLECMRETYEEYMFYDRLDSTWITFDMLFGICSILHLTIISLERYTAICWPLHHRTASRRGYSIAIAVAWFLACVGMAVIQIFLLVLTEAMGQAYIIISLVYFFIPMLIIVVTYCLICRAVRRSAKSMAKRGNNQHKDEVKRKQLRLTITMAIVIGAFVFTWAPQFANAMTSTLCSECDIRILYLIVKAFQYFGSALNPIIYAIRMPEFKRTLTRSRGSSASPKTVDTCASMLSDSSGIRRKKGKTASENVSVVGSPNNNERGTSSPGKTASKLIEKRDSK